MPSPTGNSDSFFGFELLYKTIEKSVARKSDILVALVHFVLMNHSNFRCLGVGEDKTISDTEVASEFLPDGWNEEPERYALRYKVNEQLYLLLGYTSETSFILNLLDVKSHKVSNIVFEPDTIVEKTIGSIADLVPTASKVAYRIQKELIDPVYGGSSRDMTTQTIAQNPEQKEPKKLRSPIISTSGMVHPDYYADYYPDFHHHMYPIGEPDNINPFQGRPTRSLSGLARFDPIGLPRFDPIGPFGRSIRRDQSPDHLQPPGFGFFP